MKGFFNSRSAIEKHEKENNLLLNPAKKEEKTKPTKQENTEMDEPKDEPAGEPDEPKDEPADEPKDEPAE